ncbi:MAG: bifunctional riboflavin kinase/FAD synthetase [Ruminococcus sp.]|nr:bifunctional riboflavin kinase/FAD synthetase [Ruminococcus sp.]
MQIFDSIRKTEYKTTVALGFFDGVHKGHAEVVGKCAGLSGKSVATVLTFKKSPSAVLATKKPLLTSNEVKFRLFEKNGVEDVFCIDFEEVMNLSPYEFVADILVAKLNAECIVTGRNYHFGKGGKAGVDDLRKLCDELGIELITCDGVMYEGKMISSTRIRECIALGEIEKANAMLGYDFFIESEIISGNHIGKKLSFPTINQRLSSEIITPRFGVYATEVVVGERTHKGATNIGTHPTVGDSEPVCETHILDYNGEDLYGETVKTVLRKFIREERKFSNIDELKAQIERDKSEILSFFA